MLRQLRSAKVLMNSSQPENVHKLLGLIRRRRRDLRGFVDNAQPTGKRLTNVNIIFGGLAAVFTTTPLIWGKPILGVFGESNPGSPAWKWLLGLAACSSLLSTTAAGIYRQRDIAARLVTAETNIAKLTVLEAQLELEQAPFAQAVEEYKKAVEEYKKIINDTSFILSDPDAGPIKGEIKKPRGSQAVDRRKIRCSGSSRGIGEEDHLWLAVEIKNYIWPKGSEIFVDPKKGTWECAISEPGGAEEFCLALYVATKEAHKEINDWQTDCDRTGNYEGLRKVPGLTKIDWIDGLHQHAAGHRMRWWWSSAAR
jgi:hypothetical protein